MSLQARFKKSSAPASPCTAPFCGPRMMSPEKAAEYINVCIDRMYEMIRSGEMPFVLKSTGKRPVYSIDRCDLDRWIDKNKQQNLAAVA
jgi:excisionase family DNA binding protein